MECTKRRPDSQVLKYLHFYHKRLDGRSEPEIAASLGASSPAELYAEPKDHGFPVGDVCGATPAKGNHCAPPETKHDRQARSSGPPTKLPPATAATPLFEEAIEALTKAVEHLEHRREHIQGGRFVVGEGYTEPVYVPRSSISDAEWRTPCHAPSHVRTKSSATSLSLGFSARSSTSECASTTAGRSGFSTLSSTLLVSLARVA
jgi:hypothetical protein